MAVVGDLESDLHKIARGRNDDYRRSHLFAHRHIVDRPGLANGDLKSMGALSRALRRDTTVPKFVRAPDRQSPGVIGLLVEAELEFRANRRQLRGLSMRSKLYRYLHPTLGLTYGPITVEIDGEYEALPVELKTVSTFDALECNQRKMRAMIMQLAGQAIAKNVDEGVLIIAEREGSRLTAIRIGNLRQYHCNNVARWIAELGINPESTDTMHKDWIGNYNQTSFTAETQRNVMLRDPPPTFMLRRMHDRREENTPSNLEENIRWLVTGQGRPIGCPETGIEHDFLERIEAMRVNSCQNLSTLIPDGQENSILDVLENRLNPGVGCERSIISRI